MLNKKYHFKETDVFNILGNYFTTDGYQLKIQFNNSNNEEHNISKLFKANYTKIKCDETEVKNLNTKGIYDISNVNLDNKNELIGRTFEGCDPGIANIITTTRTKINKKMLKKNKNSINLNEKKVIDSLKNTNQVITNGDYQTSWYKGPYRVLEKQWRKKHNVEDIFRKLSDYSLRTCNDENILNYSKILFSKENYKKILAYKQAPERRKWRYKRLLGKRSYIDKLTNNMAHGDQIKKYGRERKHHKCTKSEPTIVFFGGGTFKTSMKNYNAVPRKNILRVLARKTLVFLVNEHNTSKCCCKCDKKLKLLTMNGKNKKVLKNRIYNKWTTKDARNVRYCENTGCVSKNIKSFIIDRDINAANNILKRGLLTLLGGKQPSKHNKPLIFLS